MQRWIMLSTWPMLRNLANIAPLTAAGISAELNTMKGAFPPSSSDSFLTVWAQPAISNCMYEMYNTIAATLAIG